MRPGEGLDIPSRNAYSCRVKLPLCLPEITRPAPHTLVGYPPLPARLPKLMGTREGPQRKTDNNMNFDQPAIGIA